MTVLLSNNNNNNSWIYKAFFALGYKALLLSPLLIKPIATMIRHSSIQGISSYQVPIYLTWVECGKCRFNVLPNYVSAVPGIRTLYIVIHSPVAYPLDHDRSSLFNMR